MRIYLYSFLLLLLLACEQEPSDILGDIPSPVIARFDGTITDDSIVTFVNRSVGAESFIWDFGDGTTSTRVHPTHSFTHGFYTVSLEALGPNGTNTAVQSFDIVTEEFVFEVPPIDTFRLVSDKWTLLTGGPDSSKTWVIANEDDALQFGPKNDPNTKWWGIGSGDRAARTCLLDNEFTFYYDSTYVRNTNGAIWKEFNMFDVSECMAETGFQNTLKSTASNAWGSGTYDFALRLSGDSTIIETEGFGSYIGHYVMGVDDSSWQPAQQYSYTIISITEDRMELIAYGFAGDSPISGFSESQGDRYWKVTLVTKP